MSEPIDNLELVGRLTGMLDLRQLGENLFEGDHAFRDGGRLFGGQVIAQALVAALRTVDDEKIVHSLHAYFLRAGSDTVPVRLEVARDFDGRSFANRRVVATQDGKAILNLAASFQRPEDGVTHQDEMPDVPAPDDLLPDEELAVDYLHKLPPAKREAFTRLFPMEFRSVDKRHWMNDAPAPPFLRSWFRARSPLPSDPQVHRAVLAYASDYLLLGTAFLPHGLSSSEDNVASASLDHALWFHGDIRADEWMLYVTDSPWAGRARGFNRGRIFAQDGRLIASVAQEGMIRRRSKQG